MNEIFIKIEGLNLFRIAQRLIDNGIMVSNLKIKKSYMLFSINKRYIQKLKEVCKKERKYFYVVKDTKIKRFFAKLPLLLGNFLAFLLLFAVFCGIYNVVFCVEICSDKQNQKIENEVSEILLNHNIKAGAIKSELSTKEIENLILNSSSNISGCSVFFEGLNLKIKVFEAMKKDEKLKELKSNYDAIITKIETFAGESKLKKGDIVKTGDLLIKSDIEAKGEVFGKVYFSSTRIFNEKQSKEVETGKIFETDSISILGLFNLKNEEDCEFKNFKLEKQKHNIFQNLFIPIEKTKYIFREIKIEEEFVSFESVEDAIKEELKIETLAKLPELATAKNITYSVVKEGELVRIDCFVETEISLIWEPVGSFFVFCQFDLLFC